MKKIFLLFTICLWLGMVGCSTEHTMKIENPQQRAFDTFLANKRVASYNYNNEIQRKELYKSFEKDLQSYLDTIPLFVNWKGFVEDIKTEESGSTTALKFKIIYIPEQHRKITFYCTHLIATDSLNIDHLYLTMKNMPNGWGVCFDGFIRTKNNGEVCYRMGSAGDELNIAYPDYEFWVTDIDPDKGNDALSANMQNAISIALKINEPLRKEYLKLITEEESRAQFNELLPSFNKAKGLLSNSEKQYIQRLSTCLTYNYLYGE